MKWFLYLYLFLSLSAQAQVSSDHVKSMIDQMVDKGVISKEEADKAKIRMLSLSAEQWGQINKQAASIAARSPASANIESHNKIEEIHGIDLDSAQFKQIQQDLGKIIPSHKD